MARSRGRDNPTREKKSHKRVRPREVFVFSEGKETELSYIDILLEHGVPAAPDRPVTITYKNQNAASKYRKPLPLVEAAIPVVAEAERQARQSGLRPDDWNWPQVWCLFDRDQHKDIPVACAMARREGVRVAYSHPCFELWRLLHYQNYTSTFGGVCGTVAQRLKQRPGFVQTYSEQAKDVSPEDAKYVKPGQILGGYQKARKFAEQINKAHRGSDPTRWDPYTDVFRFVEDALGYKDY
ncbi:RloB family protein [Nocardiopsis rhodophaea]|uniref:RloB family protein n=1 Tax=Nocardiopsis rhodophaea TaxID=280238 RepID=UPI0031D6455C